MASAIYRFGEFQLDPASRELRRGDEDLALPLKVFDCIVYLVENRDRAVGRDELIEAVWGDAHLSDSVLGQAILLARKALDDTGEEQHVIKTVRGFGYRWTAPIDVARSLDPARTARWPRRRPLWLLLGILAMAVLATGWAYLRQDRAPEEDAKAESPMPSVGEIAILLPVKVEAGEGRAWIRLGLMDMIAERLRAAGQAMVPSDTVIALVERVSSEPDPAELNRLTAATGARLVLAARAQVTGTRWTVSLHSLRGVQPPLAAVGEAPDVLEAARVATSQLATSLGLESAPEPAADPGLDILLRKTEAAILAQQMDEARELVEAARPKLREHPEVRLQLAWIEVYSHRLDDAQAGFEALLEEESVAGEPLLRARALYGLGGVHYRRGEHRVARSVLEEATGLLHEEDALGTQGRVWRALGLMASMDGDFDEARIRLAKARIALEATGDVKGLAASDNHFGVLAALRERYADALHYFESAADRYAASHDIGSELSNLANMVEMRLGLLEPQAALAAAPRLNELLAQTVNPELTAAANLARVYLLDATGRSQAAESLLAEILDATETRDDLLLARLPALVFMAERRARAGDLVEAGRIAAKVADQMSQNPDILQDDGHGRAQLVLVRSHLAQGDLTAAREAVAAMTDWVRRTEAPSPTVYVALAEAELAAAERRDDDAEVAFERALALADSGQVPLRLLQIAESYVPWLLDRASREAADVEHVLVVADSVMRYADQHYGAALLQLRIYHALGPPSAWRIALARARALAGERQIPPELQEPPPARRTHRNDVRVVNPRTI